MHPFVEEHFSRILAYAYKHKRNFSVDCLKVSEFCKFFFFWLKSENGT